jgi:lysozyme family protein
MAVTAPKFEDIHSTYDEEWKMLTVRGDRLSEVTSTAREIAAEKATFLAVEKATGVPWYFVGLIC